MAAARPTLQAGLPAAEASAHLAQQVGGAMGTLGAEGGQCLDPGLRGRMLAWHLGASAEPGAFVQIC